MGASHGCHQCDEEDTNETRGGRHKAESREFHDVLLVRISEGRYAAMALIFVYAST
jgi:hypothetical protein